MISSCGIGRFTSGLVDWVWQPRHRTARPVVVYCGGMNGNPHGIPGDADTSKMLRTLIEKYSFSVVCPQLDATWGNATGRSRIADAVTWARANLVGTNDPIVLIGGSHGGGSAINYAATNPTLVACIVLAIPAIDYQALRVNNPMFDVRGSIDLAFGVTYPAALPVNSNPALRTAAVSGIPIQIWTASDDPISINHAAFSAAVGAETHNLGALGHTGAAIAAIDGDAVALFAQQNA